MVAWTGYACADKGNYFLVRNTYMWTASCIVLQVYAMLEHLLAMQYRGMLE